MIVFYSSCTHLFSLHTRILISPSFLCQGALESQLLVPPCRMMYVFCMIWLTHKVVDTEKTKGGASSCTLAGLCWSIDVLE